MVSEDVVLRVSGAYGVNIDFCRLFLNRIPDRIYVSDFVVALYFKLSDEVLEMLRYGLIDITDGKEVMRLFSMDGDNFHFVSAVVTGSGLFSMRRLKCKSFSWFTPDLKRFVYFKRR